MNMIPDWLILQIAHNPPPPPENISLTNIVVQLESVIVQLESIGVENE